MNNTDIFFSSAAIFKVSCALASAKSPLCLRDIEALTDLGIRSVQLATEKLVKLRLLKTYNKLNRRYFSFTKKANLEEINLIVESRRSAEIKTKSALYSKRSRQVILRTSELVRFSKYTRVLNKDVRSKLDYLYE